MPTAADARRMATCDNLFILTAAGVSYLIIDSHHHIHYFIAYYLAADDLSMQSGTSIIDDVTAALHAEDNSFEVRRNKCTIPTLRGREKV